MTQSYASCPCLLPWPSPFHTLSLHDALPISSEAPKVPEAPKGPNPREFLVAKQNLDPALITRITTDLVDVKVFPENIRSEEHTSELQSRENLVCRLLLEKKKK